MRTVQSIPRRAAGVATLVVFALSAVAGAQTSAPAPAPGSTPPPAGASAPADAPAFTKEELGQLAAPIALYPDSLLAQVFMAATYPLDIVSADRWRKANPNLKDKALEDALEKQPWDPSVKSLTVFPQVLTMMSEKLDWTQKLGDAVLAQQADLMNAVQELRSKAVAQGNLKDSKEQKVVTEVVESKTIVKIEPTNPEVVYVPTYNPTVVYGGWPYPAYPPYYYYPPGYVAGGALLGFTAGVIVGGALWGNCNWGGNDININTNRYNNFNKTNISNGNFQHNSNRRGAVPYRDQKTAQQFNRGGGAGSQARDQYRGRDAGGGFQQTGARDSRGQGAAGGRSDMGARASPMDSRGGGAGAGNRGGGGGAFDTGSRSQTMGASNRGASSMSSARSSGFQGGGGARGGGGGARGGGGGRGGGGRR